jgi:hypothetical protein
MEASKQNVQQMIQGLQAHSSHEAVSSSGQGSTPHGLKVADKKD